MKKLEPIGLNRNKGAGKKDEEQISFRLSGEDALLKRRFAAILAERGLEIKQVLLEFIDYYVRYKGEIGVGRIDDLAESSSFPQKNHKLIADLTANAENYSESSMATIDEACYSLLGLIFRYGTLDTQEAITHNLDTFGKLVVKELNGDESDTHASETLISQVQRIHERAQAAIRRSRGTRAGNRRGETADRPHKQSSA